MKYRTVRVPYNRRPLFKKRIDVPAYLLTNSTNDELHILLIEKQNQVLIPLFELPAENFQETLYSLINSLQERICDFEKEPENLTIVVRPSNMESSTFVIGIGLWDDPPEIRSDFTLTEHETIKEAASEARLKLTQTNHEQRNYISH